MKDVKTMREALSMVLEYHQAVRAGTAPAISKDDALELHGKLIEGLFYDVEELKRSSGLGPQFVSMSDVPTRLR